MNPSSVKEAVSLVSNIDKKISSNGNVVLCPPFIYIGAVRGALSKKSSIKLGAQDCFYEEGGSFTGEIAPSMLKSMDVKYAIIGHSERRARGESNDIVNKKIRALLKKGIKVILCVGEEERDETGLYLKRIEEQVKEGLRGVSKNNFKNIIVAYEPVWAIGSDASKNCDPKDIKEISIFIKKILVDLSSREIGLSVQIIYGGSVDVKNAPEIVSNGGVDGLLAGRASLDAKKFSDIINLLFS